MRIHDKAIIKLKAAQSLEDQMPILKEFLNDLGYTDIVAQLRSYPSFAVSEFRRSHSCPKPEPQMSTTPEAT
jgi:hypothetical protein